MDKYFLKFVEEAELFFVKKYIYNSKLEKKISFCLDVIFNITKNPEIDYSKGIIVFSKKYGQGKSFFFEVVFHRHRRLYNKNLYKRTTSKDLVNVFKEQGESGLLEFINVKNIFIDDIGDEGDNKEFSHYNNKMNVIRFVMLKRYELWVEKGWRTFGTTNLTIQDIAENYDGRVADRIMQMVYFEEFDFLEKGSFRQVKESRKLTQEEINFNLQKFKKEEQVQKVDVKAYMNGLLKEKDEYLYNLGEVTWTMIRNYLLENRFLEQKEIENIPDNVLETARVVAKKNARENIKVLMANCLKEAQRNALDKRISSINNSEVLNIAQNSIAKRRFFELKEQPNFKF